MLQRALVHQTGRTGTASFFGFGTAFSALALPPPLASPATRAPHKDDLTYLKRKAEDSRASGSESMNVDDVLLVSQYIARSPTD